MERNPCRIQQTDWQFKQLQTKDGWPDAIKANLTEALSRIEGAVTGLSIDWAEQQSVASREMPTKKPPI
ncbi:hypothetical protein, partial [Cyanobium sp. ULC082]